MQKRRLGRGLDALITESAAEEERRKLVNLSINEIRPNPYQPRLDFDSEKIAELARSIEEKGVLQPLIVSRRADGYDLVVGERRLRAAGRAGLSEVPCIIMDVPDEELLEVALVENLQREDLDPIEEARAYELMTGRFGLSHEEIARRVGKNRSTVTNSLRLLKLPDEVQELMRDGKLTAGHARTLLSIEEPDEQIIVANSMVEKGLSVREAEETQRAMVEAPVGIKQRSPRRGIDPRIRRVEEELQRYFGTLVKLKGSPKGTISIKYYSMEDLNRLLDILGIEM
jgi:ParB family chromosome partitioning protein